MYRCKTRKRKYWSIMSISIHTHTHTPHSVLGEMKTPYICVNIQIQNSHKVRAQPQKPENKVIIQKLQVDKNTIQLYWQLVVVKIKAYNRVVCGKQYMIIKKLHEIIRIVPKVIQSLIVCSGIIPWLKVVSVSI